MAQQFVDPLFELFVLLLTGHMPNQHRRVEFLWHQLNCPLDGSVVCILPYQIADGGYLSFHRIRLEAVQLYQLLKQFALEVQVSTRRVPLSLLFLLLAGLAICLLGPLGNCLQLVNISGLYAEDSTLQTHAQGCFLSHGNELV